MTQEPASYSSAFFALVRHPIKFRLYLLKNLPAAYFSGLRIRSVTGEKCEVSIPYKWFTRNPFRCTYFACLSMAAEMATGILAMAANYKSSPRVSMLVTAVEGTFYKRAKGLTTFVCAEGHSIQHAIAKTIASREPQSVKILSSGFNEENELIAEFSITWSFKARQ